jgi:signal transduction histidine kinase
MSIQLLVQATFIAILVTTLRDYMRRRDRLRLDIFLMCGSLTLPSVLPSLSGPSADANPLLGLVSILAIMVQPLLLLALVSHFQPVPRRVTWLAWGGMAGTLAIFVAGGDPAVRLGTVALVAYFVATEGYSVWAFWKAASASGGVAQRRLTFGAAGSIVAALTILVSGLLSLSPALERPGTELSAYLALVVAGCYFLAFATPRGLRRAWQLGELYRYLRAPAAREAEDPVGARLAQLCTAATRSTGGLASAAWLWEAEAGRYHLKALSVPPAGKLPALQPLAASEREPDRSDARTRLVQRPAALGEAQAALAPQADAVIAAPLVSAERTWGMLEVYLRRSTLFPDDDQEMLALLADQSAETLAREAQAVMERALFARLARAHAELKAEVAERRQAEARIETLNASLRERAALLEAANQELEAFSYSVSHDLRSPLRAIDGFSQALLEDYHDQLDATGRDYLERIRRAAKRMAQLIDDLLELARVSRANLTVDRVDLSALARLVLAELRAAEPGREVETVVAEGLTVQADARLLRVALENLLGNAWKFTARQPRARIELRVEPLHGQQVYCVRDNGAGFDMSNAERLFSPFQRLHTPDDFPGTGIGLAIVQRIIARHGGRIWAEGAPGHGAAIHFMLGWGRAAEAEPNARQRGGQR